MTIDRSMLTPAQRPRGFGATRVVVAVALAVSLLALALSMLQAAAQDAAVADAHELQAPAAAQTLPRA